MEGVGEFVAKSVPANMSCVPTSLGEPSLASTLSYRERNSKSSKRCFSSDRLGSSTFNASISNSIGTSVLIVARNFEKAICSLLVSTFVLRAPLSWSVCSNKFSMLPNSLISFWAVFSPTPGQPGILSEASPIKPSRSMTCRVDDRSYFAFTSSGPIISNPPVNLGRYIYICSFTS